MLLLLDDVSLSHISNMFWRGAVWTLKGNKQKSFWFLKLNFISCWKTLQRDYVGIVHVHSIDKLVYSFMSENISKIDEHRHGHAYMKLSKIINFPTFWHWKSKCNNSIFGLTLLKIDNSCRHSNGSTSFNGHVVRLIGRQNNAEH